MYFWIFWGMKKEQKNLLHVSGEKERRKDDDDDHALVFKVFGCSVCLCTWLCVRWPRRSEVKEAEGM